MYREGEREGGREGGRGAEREREREGKGEGERESKPMQAIKSKSKREEYIKVIKKGHPTRRMLA
jgi:hypothetical protein